MPRGRPSAYSLEIADAICERLADGESLRSICEAEGMPSKSMVFRWLGERQDFRDRYALAREAQADTFVDDITNIADDGRNDWMEQHNSDGEAIGWRENGEAMRRSQIRIDARKWLASKLRPKKYGDKVQIGGDPDGVPVKVEDVGDVARRMAFVLASAQPKDETSA